MQPFYSEEDIVPRLVFLPGWYWKSNQLERHYEFQSFGEAFAFLTRVALLAEQKNHHPDWKQSYCKIQITLTTHSKGGVTDKDLEMATLIEGYASGQNS